MRAQNTVCALGVGYCGISRKLNSTKVTNTEAQGPPDWWCSQYKSTCGQIPVSGPPRASRPKPCSGLISVYFIINCLRLKHSIIDFGKRNGQPQPRCTMFQTSKGDSFFNICEIFYLLLFESTDTGENNLKTH